MSDIVELLREVADQLENGDKIVYRASYTPVTDDGNEAVHVEYADSDTGAEDTH